MCDYLKTLMITGAGFVSFEWDGAAAQGYTESQLYDEALRLAQERLGCCVTEERRGGYLIFRASTLSLGDFLDSLGVALPEG